MYFPCFRNTYSMTMACAQKNQQQQAKKMVKFNLCDKSSLFSKSDFHLKSCYELKSLQNSENCLHLYVPHFNCSCITTNWIVISTIVRIWPTRKWNVIFSFRFFFLISISTMVSFVCQFFLFVRFVSIFSVYLIYVMTLNICLVEYCMSYHWNLI